MQWTMRQHLLVAFVFAFGCSRANTTKPLMAPREPAFVTISSFDCAKNDVFPGEQPQRGIISPNEGIRAWRGGGPYGASWNVDSLRCSIRATTPCTEGKVMFTLRVGQQTLAEREVVVSGGAAESDFVLPHVAWEKGIDKPSPNILSPNVYETATFRGEAVIDCQAPMKVSGTCQRE